MVDEVKCTCYSVWVGCCTIETSGGYRYGIRRLERVRDQSLSSWVMKFLYERQLRGCLGARDWPRQQLEYSRTIDDAMK
jgi:hypothetical protein